jgi:hypothetical protein
MQHHPRAADRDRVGVQDSAGDGYGLGGGERDGEDGEDGKDGEEGDGRNSGYPTTD